MRLRQRAYPAGYPWIAGFVPGSDRSMVKKAMKHCSAVNKRLRTPCCLRIGLGGADIDGASRPGNVLPKRAAELHGFRHQAGWRRLLNSTRGIMAVSNLRALIFGFYGYRGLFPSGSAKFLGLRWTRCAVLWCEEAAAFRCE